MPPRNSPLSSDSTVFRDGSEEEVLSRLESIDFKLNEQESLSILTNPNCTWKTIHHIAESKDLTSFHKVRFALVRNPTTPSPVAQRFVPVLYWKELLEITLDQRTPPLIRRIGEKTLRERLPGMGLGEKISLARRAPQALLPDLRREKHLKVIEALMENPRMTIVHLQVIANDPGTSGEILTHLSRLPKWSNQYCIKMALVKNPATPLGTALGFLSSLKRIDLQGITKNPAIRHAIKVAAQNLLERR